METVKEEWIACRIFRSVEMKCIRFGCCQVQVYHLCNRQSTHKFLYECLFLQDLILHYCLYHFKSLNDAHRTKDELKKRVEYADGMTGLLHVTKWRDNVGLRNTNTIPKLKKKAHHQLNIIWIVVVHVCSLLSWVLFFCCIFRCANSFSFDIHEEKQSRQIGNGYRCNMWTIFAMIFQSDYLH